MDPRVLLKTRLSDVLRTTRPHLEALREVGVVTVEDFFHYFPRAYRDHSDRVTISELRGDQVNVVQGKLTQMFTRRTKTGKTMTRAILVDPTGEVEVLWFNQPHIQRLFRNGDDVVLTGKIKFERAKVTLLSP